MTNNFERVAEILNEEYTPEFYMMEYTGSSMSGSEKIWYVLAYDMLKNGKKKGLIYNAANLKVTIGPVAFNGFTRKPAKFNSIPPKIRAKFEKKISQKNLNIDTSQL